MASKRQMGFKCRIAVVLLLLLGSIAGLIAVAVIQDTWGIPEYNLEVSAVEKCLQIPNKHVNI